MAQRSDKAKKLSHTKSAQSGTGPWSVRGVSFEARNAASLAAKRAGKTVGEWVEGVVVTAANTELRGPSVPAKQETDTLQAILQQLEKRDAEAVQIREELAAIRQERRGWLARLLGR